MAAANDKRILALRKNVLSCVPEKLTPLCRVEHIVLAICIYLSDTIEPGDLDRDYFTACPSTISPEDLATVDMCAGVPRGFRIECAWHQVVIGDGEPGTTIDSYILRAAEWARNRCANR